MQGSLTLVSKSDSYTRQLVSKPDMGILQPICPKLGKTCQCGGGVGAMAAMWLWRLQQHPSRVHFSCSFGKLIAHALALGWGLLPIQPPKGLPLGISAGIGLLPSGYSAMQRSLKMVCRSDRAIAACKPRPTSIWPPKGLAGLGLLLFQLQCSASTQITFQFLQKSPADVR